MEGGVLVCVVLVAMEELVTDEVGVVKAVVAVEGVTEVDALVVEVDVAITGGVDDVVTAALPTDDELVGEVGEALISGKVWVSLAIAQGPPAFHFNFG